MLRRCRYKRHRRKENRYFQPSVNANDRRRYYSNTKRFFDFVGAASTSQLIIDAKISVCGFNYCRYF